MKIVTAHQQNLWMTNKHLRKSHAFRGCPTFMNIEAETPFGWTDAEHLNGKFKKCPLSESRRGYRYWRANMRCLARFNRLVPSAPKKLFLRVGAGLRGNGVIENVADVVLYRYYREQGYCPVTQQSLPITNIGNYIVNSLWAS